MPMPLIQVGRFLSQVDIVVRNANMLFLANMLVTQINRQGKYTLIRLQMNIGNMDSHLIIFVLL